MSRIAGVVLAAGRGSRFDAASQASKASALLNGEPLISHVVACAMASRLDEIVVVTGHGAASLPVWPARVTTVHNPDYADGLASSLRVGLDAVAPEADGVLVLLADMPLISPATLDSLQDRFAVGDVDAVVPTYRNNWGNPVLIGRGLFDPIRGLRGDCGARALLRQPGRRVAIVQVDDPMITVDVDTPAALAALNADDRQAASRAGCAGVDQIASDTRASISSAVSGGAKK